MASWNKKDVLLREEEVDFTDYYENKHKEKPTYWSLFKYKSVRNNTIFATILRFIMMFGNIIHYFIIKNMIYSFKSIIILSFTLNNKFIF